jgi:hypothetical protein
MKAYVRSGSSCNRKTTMAHNPNTMAKKMVAHSSTSLRYPIMGHCRTPAQAPLNAVRLTPMRLIEHNEGLATIELTDDELVLVNNALNEILCGSNAIDAPEFRTRVGGQRHQAEQLLAAFNAILGA